MVALWEWVSIVILLLLSAFFSGSETALVSLNQIRAQHLRERGIPRADILMQLVSRPNRLLSTILVGNNIVNIAMSSLATSIALRVFGSEGVGIAVGVVTLLVLIFGEITPKSFAAVNNEKVALWVSLPIFWLQKLFYPLIRVLGAITNLLFIILGTGQTAPDKNISEEEIRIMVDLGEGQGVIESQEREMIDNVFELNDTLVREVMVPRVDIVAVEAGNPLLEAWNKVIKYGHSRLPVFEGSMDNIIGVLYAKDLMARHQHLETEMIKNVMREAYHVPETKHADELLREMRRERVHIAVVLDEFGGTAGIVFFEDLVETIIGEIRDEYDEFCPLVETIKPGIIKFNARVSVDDVNELTGLKLPAEDFDTVGGFVFHLIGQVPVKGDKIEFDDCTLSVAAMEGRRIKEVVISRKK